MFKTGGVVARCEHIDRSMKTSNLKSAFLASIDYVLQAGESADQAFDRLRKTNPDLFPSPREGESFWDTIKTYLALRK